MVNDDLRLFLNYRRLKEIQRCNNFPTVGSYDVAQHSFYVTVLCMFIGDEVNEFIDSRGLSVMDKVSIDLLLRKALLHDAEESVTSDIPWNIKHSSKELNVAIENAVTDKVHVLYENVSDTVKVYEKLCNNCKQGDEGHIVGAVDMLELALYCMEDYKKGNLYIEGLLLKCIGLFPKNPVHSVLMQRSSTYKSLVEFISNYKESSVDSLLYVE